jgi:hypothetical protein
MNRIYSALKRVSTALAQEKKTADGETIVRLLHAITSHDGSCVKPMTKEALVLNAAFKADEAVVDAIDFIEADMNKKEEFTAWDSSTGRKYYTGTTQTTT